MVPYPCNPGTEKKSVFDRFHLISAKITDRIMFGNIFKDGHSSMYMLWQDKKFSKLNVTKLNALVVFGQTMGQLMFNSFRVSKHDNFGNLSRDLHDQRSNFSENFILSRPQISIRLLQSAAFKSFKCSDFARFNLKMDVQSLICSASKNSKR